VAVLLGVGPVPVAVLEVDPEVLDRLALKLGLDAAVEVGRELGCRPALRASRPTAAARLPGDGACSAKTLSASAPSFGAESDRKSCAPP
jgi:hypothetical protein